VLFMDRGMAERVFLVRVFFASTRSGCKEILCVFGRESSILYMRGKSGFRTDWQIRRRSRKAQLTMGAIARHAE